MKCGCGQHAYNRFLLSLRSALLCVSVAPSSLDLEASVEATLLALQVRITFGIVKLGLDVSVWSMPGGFTSGGREGYQTVDEEAVDPPKPVTRPPAPQGPPRQEAPGGYQAS